MIKYKTKTITQTLKSSAHQFDFKLETLNDLDETIDELCIELQEHSDPFAEDKCPYFGVLWPSGIVLADQILSMGSWIKSKTVLEIGCGLALPSMTASKLGALVTATDFHDDVKKFLDKNLSLNDLKLTYKKINWREDNSSLGKFDFVIGSDILYENSHPDHVANTLDKHCSSKGHIILADPGRAYLQKCVDALKNLNYHVDMFIRSATDPKGDTKDIFLFSCQKS